VAEGSAAGLLQPSEPKPLPLPQPASLQSRAEVRWALRAAMVSASVTRLA